MMYKVQESLSNVLNITSQIFYLRTFQFDIETKTVRAPRLDSFASTVEYYCNEVSKNIISEIEKTPLYRLYKTWLSKEMFNTIVEEVCDTNIFRPDYVLNRIDPEKIMPHLSEYFQYYSEEIQIMNIPEEIVKYTAYQFMADYLYHNPSVRVDIEPARLIDGKYYLNSDPTNVLVIQNALPNSRVAFNRWLYDQCPHVMDIVDFVTTAKCNDNNIITFDKHSGNTIHDVHFGMYVI